MAYTLLARLSIKMLRYFGSFTPAPLFNLSAPFQHTMTLDTHESAKTSNIPSSPNSLSNFSQLASNSDLAAASESLLIHSSTDVFTCAKSKHPASKTFGQFCQVRCQCWQKESTMLNFFVFVSRNEATHFASFSFSNSCFNAAQIAKISPPALDTPLGPVQLWTGNVSFHMKGLQDKFYQGVQRPTPGPLSFLCLRRNSYSLFV